MIGIAVAVMLTLSPVAVALDDWREGDGQYGGHDIWRHDGRWRFGDGFSIYPYDGEPAGDEPDYPYVTPPQIVDPPPFQPPWVDPPPLQPPSADPPPFLHPGW
jgi:hypothetical protein